MKYLLSEAREKKQTAFQKGWKITIIKVSPDSNTCCVSKSPWPLSNIVSVTITSYSVKGKKFMRDMLLEENVSFPYAVTRLSVELHSCNMCSEHICQTPFFDLTCCLLRVYLSRKTTATVEFSSSRWDIIHSHFHSCPPTVRSLAFFLPHVLSLFPHYITFPW